MAPRKKTKVTSPKTELLEDVKLNLSSSDSSSVELDVLSVDDCDESKETLEDEKVETLPLTQQQKRATKKKTRTSVGKVVKKRTAAKVAIKKQTKRKSGKVGVEAPKATPTTFNIVLAAISSSEDKKGVTLDAIKKYYILHHPNKDWKRMKTLVKKALLRGIEEGIILRAKNSQGTVGVQGRFMINKELNGAAKKAIPPETKPSKKNAANTIMAMKKKKGKVDVGIQLKPAVQILRMIDNNKRENPSQEKENKVPKKQGKPSQSKVAPSVKAASKKFKILRARNEQDKLDTEPSKASKSTKVKDSKALK